MKSVAQFSTKSWSHFETDERNKESPSRNPEMSWEGDEYKIQNLQQFLMKNNGIISKEKKDAVVAGDDVMNVFSGVSAAFISFIEPTKNYK